MSCRLLRLCRKLINELDRQHKEESLEQSRGRVQIQMLTSENNEVFKSIEIELRSCHLRSHDQNIESDPLTQLQRSNNTVVVVVIAPIHKQIELKLTIILMFQSLELPCTLLFSFLTVGVVLRHLS